ncbi:MAG: endonuclease domain-containing protein [Candidatus Levybacteria bacterium]|nr:endonuclease domain-containing protein [Candidatus Levybacteria bacterium]
MRTREEKLTFSRSLRKNQTYAELLLWQRLRNRQLENIKFRRQQVIGSFIVDFVSYEKMLIIELDGGQHNELYAREKDKARTKWLESQGYRIIRFWDNEVIKNLQDVMEQIRLAVTPHPDPLP